jgi:hypothetical protein
MLFGDGIWNAALLLLAILLAVPCIEKPGLAAAAAAAGEDIGAPGKPRGRGGAMALETAAGC